MTFNDPIEFYASSFAIFYNLQRNDVKSDILEEIDSKYNIKIIQKHF